MKKLFLFGAAILLGVATLTGCDTDYSVGDTAYFHIEARDSSDKELYFKRVNVDDVVKYDKDGFYNAYLKELFGGSLKYYSFDGLKYKNGDQYIFDEQTIRNRVNESVKNETYDHYDDNFLSKNYGWTIYVSYSPINYHITYVGHEDDASFAEKRTFNVTSDFDLPILTTDEKEEFKGWKDSEGNIYRGASQLPKQDISLEGVISPKNFSIIYHLPIRGLVNPNPTSYTYVDDVINLKPIEDEPLGGYFFRGWYLDEGYTQPISRIDPDDGLKTYHLYGKIDIPTYNVKYYVDEQLYDSKTITYPGLDEYNEPNVPNKDHHHNGRWSTSVSRYMDYVINALYDKDEYVVTISNNKGKTISPVTLKYGDTLKDTYEDLEALKGENESFVGLFLDASYTSKVEASYVVDSNITLYAYYEDIIHISTYAQLMNINSSYQGTYILDNDISCIGEPLPVLNEFNGVFDGNNHSIKRFNNSKNDAPTSYALFGENKGTIKNLTLEEGTFVLKNTTYGSTQFGMISTVNKGTISNVDVKNCSANFSNCYSTYIESPSDYYLYYYSGIFAGDNKGVIENCLIDEDSEVEFSSAVSYTRDTGYRNTMHIETFYGGFVGVNNNVIKNVESHASVKHNKLSISEALHDQYDTYFNEIHYRVNMGGVAGYNNPTGSIDKVVSGVNMESKHQLPDVHKAFGSTVHVGGIAGFNGGEVKSSYVNDKTNIHVAAYGEQRVGGVAGSNGEKGKIKSCYSYSNFQTNVGDGAYIYLGGIAGASSGQMNFCYAFITHFKEDAAVRKLGFAGTLVGYAMDNSSSTYSFGYLGLEEKYDQAYHTYDFGYPGTSAIYNNIAIYAPAQETVVEHVENVKELDSLEALIAQGAKYYFDEAGYVLSSDKLPYIEGVGKIVIDN